jgi:hypothetical protein
MYVPRRGGFIFTYKQKRKPCSNPVFELPSEISPLLFVVVPALPIDPNFLIFTHLYVRPPLLMSHSAIDLVVIPPRHHYRGTLRRHLYDHIIGIGFCNTLFGKS